MLKKFIVLILTFLTLFTLAPSTTFADSYFYDGKWNAHDEIIKLYFNNSRVKTDVPALIFENRTLVPVRAFFENIGATVSWNDSNKEVVVKTDKFSVKLKINSTTAYVNSEPVSLDVPAKIVSDVNNIGRTLVPVRFISEKLGYTVVWDQNTYSVHVCDDIYKQKNNQILSVFSTKSEGKDVIEIHTTGIAKPVISKLSNPDRLILDFYNFKLKMGDGSYGKEGSTYTNIRYAEHTDYSRIVVDMSGEYKYNVSNTSDSVLLTLTNTDYVANEPTNNETSKPTDVGGGLVVIDPGHGGSDPGAIGYKDGDEYIYESAINLDISLRLYNILKQKGINVAMTRTTDEYLGLKERAEYANNLDASLFICIHNNSATTPAAHGTMVYYYTSEHDNSTKSAYGITSKELADIIQNELLAAGGRYDRKIADGSKFVVLYSTIMPAILTECAFLSNAEEQELLNTEEFRQKLAEGIAKGVITALKQMIK